MVIGFDIVEDGHFQVADTFEGVPTDALFSDLGKPALDLVEPGGTGWGEVEMIAGAFFKPRGHFGGFMRSVVIQNDVNIKVVRNFMIDSI